MEDSKSVSKAKMYSVEDEGSTSSTSETTEDNVETVKPADSVGQIATANQDQGLLQAISNESSSVVSKHEDDNSIGDDDEDIDEYFNDLFPGKGLISLE